MDDPSLDEWDAEIEAEFQRVTQAAKSGGDLVRAARHIGCPVGFLADVCRLTEGRGTLVIALLLFRRTHVTRSPTGTLPNSELAPFGISRSRKRGALIQLRDAGLVELENAPGRTVRITLTWRAGK